MLALTRRPGEGVTITTLDGTKIRVFVGHIAGQQAKIAIEAPKEYKIVRNEIIGKEPKK